MACEGAVSKARFKCIVQASDHAFEGCQAHTWGLCTIWLDCRIFYCGKLELLWEEACSLIFATSFVLFGHQNSTWCVYLWPMALLSGGKLFLLYGSSTPRQTVVIVPVIIMLHVIEVH